MTNFKPGSVTGVALLAVAPVLAVAAESGYIPPRTEFGAPDFQGTWSIATQTNLTRADRFEGKLVITEEEALRIEQFAEQLFYASSNNPSDPDREAPEAGQNVGGYNTFWMDPGARLAVVNGEIRTSVIVDPPDGQLPYSENGRARLAEATLRRNNYDGPEVRPTGERCTVGFGSTGGPPKLPVLYNNMTQIVQTRDYVMLLAEMNHDARIIRLGGDYQDPPMDKWMGDSIGWYEDSTLVVETSNFHAQQALRTSLDHRFYGSRTMKVTERFTRVSDDTILYQFTVEDPETYSQPWSGELPMNLSSEQMFEYACHEGNYALPGILAGARRAEVDGVGYAPTEPVQ